MNFIKISKFSVKGIDTTRYIPRASARGISSVKSKGLKDPLRTDTKCRPERSEGSPPFPRKAKILFGWSWRRGLFPPPMINEGFTPFPTFPQIHKVFFGGVGGGSVHLLDLKRRPLAKSARGDT